MPQTAIIILNYNNYEDTLNCIDSLEQYNTAPVKIVVVDNGSCREGTVEALHQGLSSRFEGRYQRIKENEACNPQLCYLTFLVSEKNDGYACGNNKGLKLAYSDPDVDKILILNNDILFVQDIIPQLSQFLAEHQDAAIVSPLLLKKDGVEIDYNCARRRNKAYHVFLHRLLMVDPLRITEALNKKRLILVQNPQLVDADSVEIELPSGSCMLMYKSLMQEIDGFDPNTFLYHEEDILYYKIKRIGKKNYALPKLKCIHLGAGSTQSIPSIFGIRASYESADYYLANYCDCTRLTSLLFHLFKKPYLALMSFYLNLKKR